MFGASDIRRRCRPDEVNLERKYGFADRRTFRAHDWARVHEVEDHGDRVSAVIIERRVRVTSGAHPIDVNFVSARESSLGLTVFRREERAVVDENGNAEKLGLQSQRFNLSARE